MTYILLLKLKLFCHGNPPFRNRIIYALRLQPPWYENYISAVRWTLTTQYLCILNTVIYF